MPTARSLSYFILPAVLLSGCGANSLLRAVQGGHTEKVLALIELGENVNKDPGPLRYTLCDGAGLALGCAANKGHADIVRALLKAGAEVDANNGAAGDRNTALHIAAYAGHAEVVKALIEGGADATIKDYHGNTPLDLAAARHHADIVRLLKRRQTELDAVRRQPQVPSAAERSDAQARPAGVLSKAELEDIVKSAVAATKSPALPAQPAEIKSDVDQPAYSAAQNPDAYAVVLGVEKYNALPEARFAERDARAMVAHLLAMGYPQRNVVLLTGAQATRTGLVKNIEAWLPNQVSERSTVLFYFSGHGAPDARTSQAYILPMDGDPQYLEETAYPIKRLYEKLEGLKAKRVLVALDSCFSGAGGRSVLAQGTRPLVTKLTLAPSGGKVVSLSASSADEITGALEEQGHGLFTYHLLKALAETAGRGSVNEIFSALKPRVQDEARRQNRAQSPQVFGAALDLGLR